MESVVAGHALPSISVVAIRSGKIAWMHSAGWADIERKRPATPDTVYRIGSVSKSITGTVAFIAAQRGAIVLSKPITAFLPWLARRSEGHFQTASLAALLNMQAGMIQAVHYRGMKNDIEGLGQDRFVTRYALAPMPASQRYCYSNMGPELVAQAMAAVTHQRFDLYMRRVLLDPLGMRATFVDSGSVPSSLLARSYRTKLAPFEESFETDPLSGAGYLSSPRDLAKFAVFHLTGRAEERAGSLSATELEALHSPLAGAFYTFGWGKIGTGDTTVLISDGQVDGGQVTILLAPRRAVAAIAMANAANDIVTEFALATLNAMAPGLSNSFQQAAAKLQAARDRDSEAYLPLSDGWTAAGSISIDDKVRRLKVTESATRIVLQVDGSKLASTSRSSGDGFAQWKIPCTKLLPACIDGTLADATLALTRAENGYDGYIAVDSLLGLFPYEVHVRLH